VSTRLFYCRARDREARQSRARAGYEVNSWQSVIAPTGTPRPIVDTLHGAIAQTLKQPEVIDCLVTQGGNEIVATPPGPFATIIKD
jgi:tripartite-type tricarboxylate transporter receptor subunit TctC